MKTRAINTVKKIISRRNTRIAILAFASEYGFVHFGYVNQMEDGHRLIRGLTVSTAHHDQHFCVGTYDNYDVSFVERSDHLRQSKGRFAKKRSLHRWLIMEFDLHTRHDLPHIFIGLKRHSDFFYQQLLTKYPALRQLYLNNLGAHSAEFLAKYHTYGNAEHILTIEKLVRPEVSELITKHFGSLAIEIRHQSLYIYAEHITVTKSILDTMLKNGVWLAHRIDEQASRLA